MSEVTLLFPHQLFRKHPALSKDRPVYFVEEMLFFYQYNFHKQKLIFHRASMKSYAADLEKKGYTVHYIDATDKRSDIRLLLPWLKRKKITGLHYTDPTDDWLQQRLRRSADSQHLELIRYSSPLFLNASEAVDYFNDRATYFQTDFYIQQRKDRSILLDSQAKPLGGKWSFDPENRKKFPSNKQTPGFQLPKNNPFVTEAIGYVQMHFASNYGSADRPFDSQKGFFPVSHQEASHWLQQFLTERFHDFGAYEDAMLRRNPLLHHSLLSPLLNSGLLTPQEVIDAALEEASQQAIPTNSVEGFIRQLIGWREFIRLVYEREGSVQRTRNYWGFTRKIPAAFWTGDTGIEPIDHCIRQLLSNAYCHHIERLMVLGNFMLLCEFDPDEVYRWFMELFIDAYDWVMVPNVYGMTQFADGGLMTTKPYISGSNYLLKMGDWEKGDWQRTWDGLFWHFMQKQRNFFSQNPRLGLLLGTWDKMSVEKQEAHLKAAGQYFHQLDSA